MDDDIKQKILLFAALFLTFMVVMPHIFKPENKPEQQVVPDFQSEAAKPAADKAVEGEAEKSPAGQVAADEPGQVVEIKIFRDGETPEQSSEAVFTTRGAGLKKYTLPGYFHTPEKKEGEEITLIDEQLENHFSLTISRLGLDDIRGRNYELVSAPFDAELNPVDAKVEHNDAGELIFQTVCGDWQIRKIYIFDPKHATGFALRLEVTNRAAQARRLSYRLTGPAGVVPDDGTYLGALESLSASLVDVKGTEVNVERSNLTSLAGEGTPRKHSSSNLAWAGLKNRFFGVVLLSDKAGLPIETEMTPFPVSEKYISSDKILEQNFKVQQLPANKVENTAILRELVRGSQNLSEYFKSRNIAVENVTREQFIKAYEQIGGPKYVYVNSESSLSIEDVLVNPGEKITHGFRFYAGPADGDILASFDPHLNHVVAYTVGWFDFLSRWLVGLLKLIVSVVGNYGVAMILVTILVKTLLHPLTRKMLVSGHKMQLVGPKMKELQKRYAGDKARLNQEVMKLYRDEGVNPMGGCLPMLVQLPLFFALYGAFAKGFAGRQAMFIPGWISDLSLPDRLFEVGITIPFFDWEVPYFNLLPILYMILQILHMNMQPKATDPQQQQTQKMMRFMPIMFAFIFYKMPSGLVLYFTISTVYTLAEHWIIKRNLPSVPSGDGVGAALANNSDSVPVSAGVGIQQAAGKGKKKKKK